MIAVMAGLAIRNAVVVLAPGAAGAATILPLCPSRR
jgi:hypothetical protein